MKPILSYSINGRTHTAIHALTEELSFSAKVPLLFDLPNPGVLSIQGENAATFLQGQLTADIRSVNADHMCPSALCNVQGRISHLVDVVEWRGYHLLMPMDMLSMTQKTLSKPALLSRVTLKSNDSYEALGLYCPEPQQSPIPLPTSLWETLATDTAVCYAISAHLYLILCSHEYKQSILNVFKPDNVRGSLAWHALELSAGRLSIYPDTRDLFFPHRLGLQHTPYLSFQKGCYKGQEIIIRMQHRAQLKHGVYHYRITSSEPIHAGQSIESIDQGQALGEIIDFCPLDEQRYLIVINALYEHPTQVRLDGHKGVIHLELVTPE